MGTKLSPKQRLFAREYADDHNATQAAVRAGYSRHTAKQQGSRLLTNADVVALVSQHDAKRAEKRTLDVARMDELLDDVQNAVLTDAYNDDGTLKLPHEFSERLKRAVVKVKSKELFDDKGRLVGYTREVGIEGKTAAIRLGYQRRGVLVEKHQVEVIGHAELVAAAARLLEAKRATTEQDLETAGETH